MTHSLIIGDSSPGTVSFDPLSNFVTKRCYWYREQRDIMFHNGSGAVGGSHIRCQPQDRDPISRVMRPNEGAREYNCLQLVRQTNNSKGVINHYR